MPTPRLTRPAMIKAAKAALLPVRQRTQYSCMASSMAMALNALGHKCDEDGVNRVMGAQPMRGASWEQALACSQHYGCRATLTTPSTLGQVKEWTDRGVPVMIAWNPEGREWSHASVVFDVTEDPEHGLLVHVADPNIPDPDETVRVVPKAEFYKKWYEKWPDYLVRRPACAIEREVTPEGRQVMASAQRVAEAHDCYQDYKGGGMTREELQECLARMRRLEKSYRPSRRAPAPKPPPSPRAPAAPPAPKAVVNSAVAAKLGILESLLSKVHGDDKTFVEKIVAEYATGGHPSEDGLKLLRNILYRNRMKPEADHFRVASTTVASAVSVAERYLSAKQPQVVQDKKKDDPMVLRGPRTKQRDILIEQMIKHPGGTGSHHTRERDVAKGQSRKPKHKKDWRDE